MFINNPQQITEAIIQQPFDTTGNQWQPERVLEMLERGELASFAREEDKYFIYQRRGKTPPRYELTAKAPAKTEVETAAVSTAVKSDSQIIWRGETIASADPNALALLRSKLEQLQQKQERMKKATKLAKKGDLQGIIALGYSPERAKLLITPQFSYHRVGHQAYELSNNNQTIRQVKERIKELERQTDWESATYSPYPGLTVEESVEDNRIRLIFDQKPAREICKLLKTRGFVWFPSNQAWQRMLNAQGKSVTKWTIKTIKEEYEL